MRRILIRADDLGYSRGVNYGIYDAIHSGVINNVGIMVNMPFTEHGLELLQNEDIDFGMHTNITNGKPILSPNEVHSLVDENGNFKRSKLYRNNYGKPDFADLDELVAEIDAQYHEFLKLVGKKPDYFEGHAVMSKNFIEALHIVAEKYHLPILDFSFDNQILSFKKKTKFKPYMESMEPQYHPEKVLDKMIDHSTDTAIPMMICHPGYLDQYLLNISSLTVPRTQEVDMAMSRQTKYLIEKNDIQLVRYSECE